MTTLLLAGDSLAVGLTSTMRDIAAANGVSFFADATTGTTARQWASGGRLVADVQAYQPDIILVSLGTNDARGDLSTFADDVAALVDACRGSLLRWIGPPSMPFDMTTVRATLANVLGRRGVPIFPSEERDYPRAGDGIHMPPSGYAAWAQDIAAAGFFDPAGLSSSKKWIVAGGAALLLAWGIGWI